MVPLLDLATRKGVKNKKALFLVAMVGREEGGREWEKWFPPLNWEIVDSLEFKGRAYSEVLAQGRALG